MIDCEDESDESGCQTCRIPQKYKQAYKPRPKQGDDSLAVRVSIRIYSIDSIQELKSEYEVSFGLEVSWFDKRLEFYNLHAMLKVGYCNCSKDLSFFMI